MKYFLSILYRIGYKVHHLFFLRKGKPLNHAKLIVVGSFLAGGAGKTPVCIALAQTMKEFRVAILCHKMAWDEQKLLQEKLPFAKIIATSNRYKTAHEIDNDYDYILCDDGFEDSRLAGECAIRLDWEPPPSKKCQLIPFGKNRSLVQDHSAPDLVFLCYGDTPDVVFELDSITNAQGEKLPPSSKVAVLCGIANPHRFVKDLESYGLMVARQTFRPDHDRNFQKSLDAELQNSLPVVISEKDSVRLKSSRFECRQVYVARQRVKISSEKMSEFRTMMNIVS